MSLLIPHVKHRRLLIRMINCRILDERDIYPWSMSWCVLL
jgi:hypothetical protein